MTVLLILAAWLGAGVIVAALFCWRVRAGRTPDWYR